MAVVLLCGIAWLVLKVAERLYLISVPLAAAILLSALLSPVIWTLRGWGASRIVSTGVTFLAVLAVLGVALSFVVERALVEFPQVMGRIGQSVSQLPIHRSTGDQWRNSSFNNCRHIVTPSRRAQSAAYSPERRSLPAQSSRCY